jgi:translocator protein
MVKKTIELIISILICQGVGLLGALFTAPAISSWYSTISKPWFTPPNWLFAPAWTLLYLLMAIALFIIWQKKEKRRALTIFFIQLFLNFLWSMLFFGLKNPLLAFLDILLLVLTISLTVKIFYSKSKIAAFLLLPYLLWTIYASLLNLGIIILN